MARMSKYCKAYELEALRDFSFNPDVDLKLKSAREADAGDTGPDIVFIHDDYALTAGIFRDEQVLYDSPDSAWVEFCTARLAFAVPPDIAGTHAAETSDRKETVQ